MVLAKAKENPLTELPLRKGGFCAFRPAKASPSGRAGAERLRGLPLHTSFPLRIHSHQSKDRKGASPWS